MLVAVNTIVLRQLMDEQQIRVKTLAKAVGKSRSTISKLRSGRQEKTTYEALTLIAKSLGVNTARIQTSLTASETKDIFGDDDIPF